jgi:hypothetical protein
MEQSLQSMRADTLAQLRAYLSYCLSAGLTLEYLAACYNTIVTDTLMTQLFFEENKRYRWSRFEELAHSVQAMAITPCKPPAWVILSASLAST